VDRRLAAIEQHLNLQARSARSELGRLVSTKEGLSMTHEAEPGTELPPNAIDDEVLLFDAHLAKFPDDRPDDEDLVRRATENSRG
jgi:hypothetical protein